MHSTTPVGISGVMKRLQSHCGCPAPLTTPHSRDQVWCACSNCLVALRSVRSALAPRLLSVVSSLAHANEAAALFLLPGVEIDETKTENWRQGVREGCGAAWRCAQGGTAAAKFAEAVARAAQQPQLCAAAMAAQSSYLPSSFSGLARNAIAQRCCASQGAERLAALHPACASLQAGGDISSS